MDKTTYLRLVYLALENMQGTLAEAQKMTQDEFNSLIMSQQQTQEIMNNMEPKTKKQKSEGVKTNG